MLSKKVLVTSVLMTASFSSLAHASCDDTALHEQMETIKTEMKSLAFEVKKEDYAAADVRIDKIIAELKDARNEKPYLFTEEGLSGDELAKRQADYQSVIDDTVTAFMALDKAVSDENADSAKTALGEIGNLRKKGHRAFKADC